MPGEQETASGPRRWSFLACYGGPAARLARGLRRRLRILGGRAAAGRLLLSAWRMSQALRMRWLRTPRRQATHSASGVTPVRRHQPRAMLVVAGSLMVEKVRSALVRRAEGGGGAGGGGSCFCRVFAATWGGTVMVCCVQQAGGCSGGVRISGRPRSSVIEDGRSGQRILPAAGGQLARW